MKHSVTLFAKIIIANLFAFLFSFENKELHADWQQVATFGNPHNNVSCMIKKDNYIFAGTYGTGIKRSSDNGMTWTTVNNGITVANIRSFTYTAAGLFTSGAAGIYLTTNNGDSWTEVSYGPTSGLVVSLTSKGGNVYAGHGVAGVYKTTNNGTNWTRFALGEGDKLRAVIYTDDAFYLSIVTAILKTTNDGKTFKSANNGIHPYNADMFTYYGDDMYSGTDHGMFHTTNDGEEWFPINNGLTDTNITSLTNSGAVIFSGTNEEHIFCSVNKGHLWTNVTIGYADSSVTSLLSDGTYLYAGSAAGNIWRRPLSEMITGINTISSITPEKFGLHQNFPNPFNPATTIKFEIKESSVVRLKIYNSNGQEVNTLINERMNSGSYSYSFDASALSSGIYYYSIEAGDFLMTKKMMLVK